MNIYLIGITIFVIVIIVCIVLLIYFIKDEKKLKEVTDQELMRLGKVYTKEEFESKMFMEYANILSNIECENYNYLKDKVSDDIYNQILLRIKNNHDNNQEEIVTNINKEFSKLVSFSVQNNQEIAKLWIRYSSYEYTLSSRENIDENGEEIQEKVVVKGSKDTKIEHEYIITFVRDRSESEKIVCPGCGYQEHLLTSSKCIRCDSDILPKKMHWVYVDKVNTNISKQ